MSERILIHCDLDAFYAAVETIHHNLDPQVPLIIGSDPKGGQGRGIVSTCNYAVRGNMVFEVPCPFPRHGVDVPVHHWVLHCTIEVPIVCIVGRRIVS